MSISAA
jgi:hypothetical protein